MPPRSRLPIREWVRYAVLLTALLVTVASCGFRGPLYLPEDAPVEPSTTQPGGEQLEPTGEEAEDDEENDTPR